MVEVGPGDERELLLALAIAIELALNEERSSFGLFENSSLDYMVEQDARLEDYWGSKGSEFRALKRFAEYYFFCFAHGDAEMGHVPWEMAKHLLMDSAERVKRGEPIVAPEVLRYGRI